MRYLRRTLNYLEIITIFDLTHMINMIDLVDTSLETIMIDICIIQGICIAESVEGHRSKKTDIVMISHSSLRQPTRPWNHAPPFEI